MSTPTRTGLRVVEEANNGKHIIPVLMFDDGSTLIEPSNAELAEKLGLQTDGEEQVLRPHRRRQRSGRADRRALRRARGHRDAGHRARRHRRPGGRHRAARQLPRLPGRRQRRRVRRPAARSRPSASASRSSPRRKSPASTSTATTAIVRTADGNEYRVLGGAARARLDLPPAGDPRRGRLHRRGRALLRHLRRRVLPRQACARGRRRQLGRRGEHLPDQVREAR